jgi:hypothetical protein
MEGKYGGAAEKSKKTRLVARGQSTHAKKKKMKTLKNSRTKRKPKN